MIGLREPGDEAIPGYTLVCPLGSGGFGEVWKCIAPGGLNKAIKFVFGNLNSLDGDEVKAEQEFKALERVKAVRHPFVLSMDRIEVVGGELLIVMELADRSLHDCFVEYQEQGRVGIPRDILLGFLADAAEGLDHLIDRYNLQHLDVKPKNLFLICDRVKVADFGLVKHLERQSSAGLMGGVTPVYAAPETFTNKISKQSDQYSLAIVYVELLTGRKPFNGKNIRQLALQHMTEPPDLSMLPPADRAAVARALSKNPEDRFPSCAVFIRTLQGLSTPLPTSNVPTLSTALPDSLQDKKLGKTPSPRRAPELTDSNISNTVSRIEAGVLRPAILIGVGSFGRRALQQIRCRLLDRVGDLQQVPSFRYVYIDIDQDTVEKVDSDGSDAALQPEHVLHLPLQPVTGYRRKQLDQILEWMPREVLYSVPRSLSADGSRALGRLAFFDHYLKVAARLKNDIQTAIHPEAIKLSADQTGLMPRAKVPSIYVFASATGGTGGMLLDLGHTIRRVLAKFHMADADVAAFVYCGSPEDPSSPPGELANVFATLTELNHYADPDVMFSARYGGLDGPKLESNGLPFTATYLLPMAQRTPEAFRDCISHLSGYVAHELTTPLGTGLEEIRRRPALQGRTPFRGFGTFGVWFPRGLMLRSGARQLCLDLLKSWHDAPYKTVPEEAEIITQNVLTDPRLTPDHVQQFIIDECARGPDGGPLESIGKWFVAGSEQIESAHRRGEGANWATAFWDQAKDMLGGEPTAEGDSPYRRGRLSRSLDHGLKNSLSAWSNELTELLRPIEDMNGPRFLAMEHTLRRLGEAFEKAATAQEQLAPKFADARQSCISAVHAALEECAKPSAGFGLFGSRSARSLRVFANKIKPFIDARIAEDLAGVTATFYRRMCSRMDDRIRDLFIAKENLGKLIAKLTVPIVKPGSRFGASRNQQASPDETNEAIQSTLQLSNTIRVVLPNGDNNLDRAAADLLLKLNADDLQQMHEILDKLVIQPRGGLVSICKIQSDLSRALSTPMIEQATAFLSNRIPHQDVTEVEMSSQEAKSGGLAKRIGSYLRLAAPQAPGPAEEEKTYVLVPSTPSGYAYAKEVKAVSPKAIMVTVQGHGTDLMFCREQGYLRPIDLMKLIEPCLDAYVESTEAPERSPHCRFDVTEWVPLIN